MFGSLGTPELLMIVFVILLLFGARKVPELLRSVGEGVREFRKSSREIYEEIENADRPKPRPTSTTSSGGSTTEGE
jgi:sec-independent protein translocase protein TatA